MTAQPPLDISIISSVYNEEGTLRPLVERVVAVMERYPHVSAWEYLLVDDASTDGSARLLDDLRDAFPAHVRVLHHETRRGQKGCFMTGFEHAHGRISVLMDADLQVLPEELPLVLDQAVIERQQMVCTHNDVDRGGKRRHLGRQIGNLCLQWFFRSPVRDAAANFMAVETRFVRGVRLIANDQRYLVPIGMRRGIRRIADVGCVFELRAHGRSKYNYWTKIAFGVLEMWVLKRRLARGFYDAPEVPGTTREASTEDHDASMSKKPVSAVAG
jgi:dolichol-phosphate mannosyltransferase